MLLQYKCETTLIMVPLDIARLSLSSPRIPTTLEIAATKIQADHLLQSSYSERGRTLRGHYGVAFLLRRSFFLGTPQRPHQFFDFPRFFPALKEASSSKDPTWKQWAQQTKHIPLPRCQAHPTFVSLHHPREQHSFKPTTNWTHNPLSTAVRFWTTPTAILLNFHLPAIKTYTPTRRQTTYSHDDWMNHKCSLASTKPEALTNIREDGGELFIAPPVPLSLFLSNCLFVTTIFGTILNSQPAY